MEAFGFGAAAQAAIRIYRDCRPNIHAEMTEQTISDPKIDRPQSTRSLLYFTGVAPPIHAGGHVEARWRTSRVR